MVLDSSDDGLERYGVHMIFDNNDIGFEQKTAFTEDRGTHNLGIGCIALMIKSSNLTITLSGNGTKAIG